MKLKNTFRRRIMVFFIGFSLFGSVVLLGSVALVMNRIEQLFIHTFLDEELEHFIELSKATPGLNRLHENKMLGFLALPGQHYPGYGFLDQADGIPFETQLNGLTYFGLAEEKNGRHYFILFEVTEFAHFENLLLVALILVMLAFMVFTVWAAFVFSGRMIAPLTKLAGQIKNLPEAVPQRLAVSYSEDEIGELAQAFDNYMERLKRFVIREQNFTADASHELRTPITIIQGASEVLLAREDIPPEISKRIERIARSARAMSQSLDAMLLLAREPSQSSFHETADIARIILATIESNKPLLDGKPVQLDVQLTAEPVVHAAPNLVQTLLSNLVRNAFNYTSDGTVSVLLSSTDLCIADTGVGIAADDLERVFERGYRALGAHAEGSGLGLAIAKRICEHYGWELTVESEPQNGTRVCWRF